MIESGERQPDAAIMCSLGVDLGVLRAGLERAYQPPNRQALLTELDDARRQRHLLTYRALIERLDLPTPAMQTLPLLGSIWPPRCACRASAAQRTGHQPGRQSPAAYGILRLRDRPRRFRGGLAMAVAAASWHASEVARVFEFDYPADV